MPGRRRRFQPPSAASIIARAIDSLTAPLSTILPLASRTMLSHRVARPSSPMPITAS